MARKTKDYASLAREIVVKIGGKENVQSVTHCITRLRFVLKDESIAKTDDLKQMDGVMDVLRSGGQYQVVIGTAVEDVFNEVQPLLGGAAAEGTGVKDGDKKASLLDVIAAIFTPILGAMTATGILKGLLIMCTTLGFMSAESEAYTVLYAAADGFFYFLPLALCVTAARKFGCNQFVAFSIGAALVYPNLVAALGAEGGLHFLGMAIPNVSYASSVIPALAAAWVLSWLEKGLKKIVPQILQGVINPLICVVVMVPITLMVIGPATDLVGRGVAGAYSFLYSIFPPLAGAILGGFYPIIVMVGAHWGLVPIVINNFSQYGYDTLSPATTGMNYAIAGAAFGVMLKTRNKELKQLAATSGFSALVGGVVEPAIYGVVLKYKKPFYISMVCIAIGGAVAGFAGSQVPALVTTCILTLPAMATFTGGIGLVAAAGIGFFGAMIGTYLFGFNDAMIEG